jgi:two-component system phosphate regulon sensor histidine kinase PhoR
MLRVVVENLAKNAIRHAGDGASFTVTVHTDELRASDDGVGVSAYDLPRLFERFYRTDRSRASRGTGLGLAIVKHIVASAEGTIEAQGGRKQGLTIVCRFGAKADRTSAPAR